MTYKKLVCINHNHTNTVGITVYENKVSNHLKKISPSLLANN